MALGDSINKDAISNCEQPPFLRVPESSISTPEQLQMSGLWRCPVGQEPGDPPAKHHPPPRTRLSFQEGGKSFIGDAVEEGTKPGPSSGDTAPNKDCGHSTAMQGPDHIPCRMGSVSVFQV